MKEYIHRVQYYETDKMGFVHHSNYIRWFEEARSDFFEQVGAPYIVTESYGIISPVISVNCEYKKSCRYGEDVVVHVTLEKVGSVKFFVSYTVTDLEGEVRATGSSVHCFLNSEGSVVSLKRARPELYEIMQSAVGKSI